MHRRLDQSSYISYLVDEAVREINQQNQQRLHAGNQNTTAITDATVQPLDFNLDLFNGNLESFSRPPNHTASRYPLPHPTSSRYPLPHQTQWTASAPPRYNQNLQQYWPNEGNTNRIGQGGNQESFRLNQSLDLNPSPIVDDSQFNNRIQVQYQFKDTDRFSIQNRGNEETGFPDVPTFDLGNNQSLEPGEVPNPGSTGSQLKQSYSQFSINNVLGFSSEGQNSDSNLQFGASQSFQNPSEQISDPNVLSVSIGNQFQKQLEEQDYFEQFMLQSQTNTTVKNKATPRNSAGRKKYQKKIHPVSIHKVVTEAHVEKPEEVRPDYHAQAREYMKEYTKLVEQQKRQREETENFVDLTKDDTSPKMSSEGQTGRKKRGPYKKKEKPEVLEITFQCGICTRGFNDIEELKTHVNGHAEKEDEIAGNISDKDKGVEVDNTDKDRGVEVEKIKDGELENVNESEEGDRPSSETEVKDNDSQEKQTEVNDSHDTGTVTLLCGVCAELFTSEEELNKHSESHEEIQSDGEEMLSDNQRFARDYLKQSLVLAEAEKKRKQEEIEAFAKKVAEKKRKETEAMEKKMEKCGQKNLQGGVSLKRKARMSSTRSKHVTKIGRKHSDHERDREDNIKKRKPGPKSRTVPQGNMLVESEESDEEMQTDTNYGSLDGERCSRPRAKNSLMNPSKGKQKRVLSPRTRADELLLRQFGIIPSKVCLQKVPNNGHTITSQHPEEVSSESSFAKKPRFEKSNEMADQHTTETNSGKKTPNSSPVKSPKKHVDDEAYKICTLNAEFSDVDSDLEIIEQPITLIVLDDDSPVKETTKTQKSDSDLLKDFRIKDLSVNLNKTEAKIENNVVKDLFGIRKNDLDGDLSESSVQTRSASEKVTNFSTKDKKVASPKKKKAAGHSNTHTTPPIPNIEGLSADEMNKLLNQCGMGVSVPVTMTKVGETNNKTAVRSRKRTQSPEPSTSKGHGVLKRKHTARKSCPDADLMSKFKLKESSVQVKCLSKIEVSMLRNPHSSFGKSSWLKHKFDTDSESDIEWDIPSPAVMEDFIEDSDNTRIETPRTRNTRANSPVKEKKVTKSSQRNDKKLLEKFGLSEPVVVLESPEKVSSKQMTKLKPLHDHALKKFGKANPTSAVSGKEERSKQFSRAMSDEELLRKYRIPDLKVIMDSPKKEVHLKSSLATAKPHKFSFEEFKTSMDIATKSLLSKLKDKKKQNSNSPVSAGLKRKSGVTNQNGTDSKKRNTASKSSVARATKILRKTSTERKQRQAYVEPKKKSREMPVKTKQFSMKIKATVFPGRNARLRSPVKANLAIKTSKARSVLKTLAFADKSNENTKKIEPKTTLGKSKKQDSNGNKSIKKTDSQKDIDLSSTPYLDDLAKDLPKLSVRVPCMSPVEIEMYTQSSTAKKHKGSSSNRLEINKDNDKNPVDLVIEIIEDILSNVCGLPAESNESNPLETETDKTICDVENAAVADDHSEIQKDSFDGCTENSESLCEANDNTDKSLRDKAELAEVTKKATSACETESGDNCLGQPVEKVVNDTTNKENEKNSNKMELETLDSTRLFTKSLKDTDADVKDKETKLCLGTAEDSPHCKNSGEQNAAEDSGKHVNSDDSDNEEHNDIDTDEEKSVDSENDRKKFVDPELGVQKKFKVIDGKVIDSEAFVDNERNNEKVEKSDEESNDVNTDDEQDTETLIVFSLSKVENTNSASLVNESPVKDTTFNDMNPGECGNEAPCENGYPESKTGENNHADRFLGYKLVTDSDCQRDDSDGENIRNENNETSEFKNATSNQNIDYEKDVSNDKDNDVEWGDDTIENSQNVVLSRTSSIVDESENVIGEVYDVNERDITLDEGEHDIPGPATSEPIHQHTVKRTSTQRCAQFDSRIESVTEH